MTQELEIAGKPAIKEFVDYFNWRIAYEKPVVVRVVNVGEEFKIVEEDGTFKRGTKNDLLLNIDTDKANSDLKFNSKALICHSLQ